MSGVNDELAADVSAAQIAALPKPPSPDRLITRDDDVTISRFIAGEISTKEEPCIYANENFWKYSTKTGAWAVYDREHVRALIMSYSGRRLFGGKDDETGETKQGKALKLNNGKVEGILRCTQTHLYQPDFFQLGRTGISFKNCFVYVDKEQGVVKVPHSPDHRCRVAVDYIFTDSKTPHFTAFMHSVFRDDDDRAEKILFLQEFVGATLTGIVTRYHKAVITFGGGSNGKSVFLDVVQMLFPESVVASVPPQSWGNEYYLARLDGVALNVVSELPENEILAAEKTKAVIVGDKVDARRPRESPFSYRPKAGHLFAANKLPQTADFTAAFWRRFTVIGFNRTFERDPEAIDRETLDSRLREEVPGIMRWAIEGAARLLAQEKYTTVSSSDRLLGEWRRDSDQVAGFLDDCCEDMRNDPDETISTMDLYRAYRKWATDVGHRNTLSLVKFGTRLSSLGFAVVEVQRQKMRRLKLRGWSQSGARVSTYSSAGGEDDSSNW